MTGMLITIEKDGTEIELRRIKDESAAAHVLSLLQVGADVELEPQTIEAILRTLNKAISNTKDFIDDLILGTGKYECYRAALVKENRKELAEYENLKALFELLYEILLNDLRVRVRMKKIVWEKEN